MVTAPREQHLEPCTEIILDPNPASKDRPLFYIIEWWLFAVALREWGNTAKCRVASLERSIMLRAFQIYNPSPTQTC